MASWLTVWSAECFLRYFFKKLFFHAYPPKKTSFPKLFFIMKIKKCFCVCFGWEPLLYVIPPSELGKWSPLSFLSLFLSLSLSLSLSVFIPRRSAQSISISLPPHHTHLPLTNAESEWVWLEGKRRRRREEKGYEREEGEGNYNSVKIGFFLKLVFFFLSEAFSSGAHLCFRQFWKTIWLIFCRGSPFTAH